MELILKLIAMISIFCFMGLAFRTNWREYKIYEDELKQEGKLPSPKTRILRALKAYGILIGTALIITIGGKLCKKTWIFNAQPFLGNSIIFLH